MVNKCKSQYAKPVPKVFPADNAIVSSLSCRLPRSASVPTSPKTLELRTKHEARRATDIDLKPAGRSSVRIYDSEV